MRSIFELEEEIKEDRHELKSKGSAIEEDVLKNAMKSIFFKEEVVSYLKTDPTMEFIKSEIGRLTNRSTLIKKGFIDWIPTVKYSSEESKKRAYYKEMGLPKVKTQLKALLYILGGKER